jgi:hypothetical protein
MLPAWRKRFFHGMTVVALIFLNSSVEASKIKSVECVVPAGLEKILQSENIILMGEVHGTKEAPLAFGTAVCTALSLGRMVSVGLELSGSEVEPLRAYMASDGGKPAVARLLQSSHWTRKFQDGRSSIAMLTLVERLRTLAHHYQNLSVFVMEEQVGPPVGPAHLVRDQTMAARVRAEHDRRPGALILTLTGNIHNRVQNMPLNPGGKPITPPMGFLLKDLSPRSVALETVGAAWVCAPDCGVHGEPAPGVSQFEPHLAYRELAGDEPYTSEWTLGLGTPSRPAAEVMADKRFSGAAP